MDATLINVGSSIQYVREISVIDTRDRRSWPGVTYERVPGPKKRSLVYDVAFARFPFREYT